MLLEAVALWRRGGGGYTKFLEHSQTETKNPRITLLLLLPQGPTHTFISHKYIKFQW